MLNPSRDHTYTAKDLETKPITLHRRLDGYRQTELHSMPVLASELGVGCVLIKHEAERMGLPAFKMLGASWATYRALSTRVEDFDLSWETFADLSTQLQTLGPLTLATATDGNHGRALARLARLLGFACEVWVPGNTVKPRIKAIQSEGATVHTSSGGYNQAVREAAEAARVANDAMPTEQVIVISDTSWPGYHEVPSWVVEGYATIFDEIDEQISMCGLPTPDAVLIPTGVGAFAAAAVDHFHRGADRPDLLCVEPVDAACVRAALAAGEVVELEGSQDSIMAGLNCGMTSPVVFDRLKAGISGTVTVDDEDAKHAIRSLAALGIEAGESGAASLAGARRAASSAGWTAETTLLLLSTEGPTDPTAWEDIVGRPPTLSQETP